MTKPDISNIERALAVATLREHDTEVYVVSVMDPDECGGVVNAVFRDANDAYAYAVGCHLQLIEGETLLIEGFGYAEEMDPTRVKIRRPDLVVPAVIDAA